MFFAVRPNSPLPQNTPDDDEIMKYVQWNLINSKQGN
jgi:hypothetical protein